MEHSCCRDRGDHLSNNERSHEASRGMNPAGDGHDPKFVVCNTPNTQLVITDQPENIGYNCTDEACQSHSHVSRREHPTPRRDLHCHTPNHPCNYCAQTRIHEINPEELNSRQNSLQDSGDAKIIHTHDERCYHSPTSQSSLEPNNEQPNATVTVHTPFCVGKPRSIVTPHTPYRSACTNANKLENQIQEGYNLQSRSPKDSESSSPVKDNADPSSRNFIRCPEKQIGSHEEEGKRSPETIHAKPECAPTFTNARELQHASKAEISNINESVRSPDLIDCPSLNHLSFKEKQLALSAVGKVASNMACATMLQERDRKKSGCIGRRDFQIVMDKVGLLKNMSSREVDAVFKGYAGNSETEMDYNKFICACKTYPSMKNHPLYRM